MLETSSSHGDLSNFRAGQPTLNSDYSGFKSTCTKATHGLNPSPRPLCLPRSAKNLTGMKLTYMIAEGAGALAFSRKAPRSGESGQGSAQRRPAQAPGVPPMAGKYLPVCGPSCLMTLRIMLLDLGRLAVTYLTRPARPGLVRKFTRPGAGPGLLDQDGGLGLGGSCL